MTESLYVLDSYVSTFDGLVSQIKDDGSVVLDHSAFYPGGGGQPCDSGSLTSEETCYQVSQVIRLDGEILHVVGKTQLKVGSIVHGQLDWERRYQLMRTHTALHILCGVVWRDYGAQVTGGNMAPSSGRMDFEFESLHAALVREIEVRVNEEVAAARDIRVQVLPREQAFQIPDLIRTKINLLPKGIERIRTVEIMGLDLQADGGTHVANTREVGEIRVIGYKSKGHINKRIQIELVP